MILKKNIFIKMFNIKNLFIIKGTGSFWKEFPIFILSRDELKKYEIENNLSSIYKKIIEKLFFIRVEKFYLFK